MSKDLKGWEQPEEKVPESIAPEEEAQLREAVIDIELPESGEDEPPVSGEGPDLLIESLPEAEEYAAAKKAAGEVVAKKHRRVEAAAPTGRKPKWEKKPAKDEKEIDEPASGSGELVIEEVLMVEEPDEEPGGKEAEAAGTHPIKAKGLGHARHMLWSKRSHGYAAPLGLAFIILALVGLISIIVACVNLTANIVDNTEEKSAFEWRIYPLLMFDPAAFDSPTQLDEVFVLKTSLWKTLLENRTKYSYNDSGMLVVPASDLDVAANSLYGGAVTLNHQTMNEAYEYYYIYDESQKAYLVPVQGQTAYYTPKVEKITKSGDVYTLLVGYVPPNDLWNIDPEGNMTEPAPSKYMYYDLMRSADNSYYIIAVRSVPREELPEDINTSGQPQLNQTRYKEYVEDYMSGQMSQGAAHAQGASSSSSGEDGSSQDGEETGSEDSSEPEDGGEEDSSSEETSSSEEASSSEGE